MGSTKLYSKYANRIRISALSLITIMSMGACDMKSSADYNREAEQLEQQGKYAAAILLLDKAIEKDNKNIFALVNRAVDKSILSDYKGAIADYNQIVAIDPNNALAYLNRGKNKSRLKEYKAAIADYQKAISTKGGESFYMDKMENSIVANGTAFDVSMEEIRFERGNARYQDSSMQLAFDDFNFCIQQGFQISESKYWRGIIYLAYGKGAAACADFNDAKNGGIIEVQELIDNYCK